MVRGLFLPLLMQYREIVAVTGMGGLFHLLSTKADGAIVRSLTDNSTKFIPARLHNVTPLESIEIYTTGENVRLHNVLQKMKDSSTSRPDTKSATPDQIKNYFREVYPEMDEDRVYASDKKKMLKWYDLLASANLLDFSALEANGEEGAEDAAAMPAEGEAQLAESEKENQTTALEGVVEEEGKPAKKARAKKSVAPKEGEEAGAEEGPKKVARKKKDSAEG